MYQCNKLIEIEDEIVDEGKKEKKRRVEDQRVLKEYYIGVKWN